MATDDFTRAGLQHELAKFVGQIGGGPNVLTIPSSGWAMIRGFTVGPAPLFLAVVALQSMLPHPTVAVV